MLARLPSLLHIRYEDRRKVRVMGTVFFLAGVAELVNYASFMALFNSRVGTQYLPFMYLTEAFLLPLEGWLLSAVSQRLSKPKFMVALYLLFATIGLLNSAVLVLFRTGGVEWIGFYPILFLTSNFVVRQQTLLMWSTAFDLCPTQQAKRVMPIFGLAAITGGVAAGVLSGLLAPILGPDLLYPLYTVFLLLGLPNFIRSLRQYLIPYTLKTQEDEEQSGSTSAAWYLKQTLRSPFILTTIGIMTLMSALYFLMEYQYFTFAQSVFDSEAALTSFYGMIIVILFCGAFVLQILATRLMNWLGAGNIIIGIAIVYACGFAMVGSFLPSALALAVVSFGYCLTYLLLYYFAEPGYQLFFKMQPIQHRDGYRFMAQGIAASAGILLGSGLSMLHSAANLTLFWQAWIGTMVSIVLIGLAWINRHLYIRELIKFLKVGANMVKDSLGELLDSMRNEKIRRTLLEKLEHPDESVQMVTIELFQRQPDPAATASLFKYLDRCAPHLRPAVLEAIHPNGLRDMSKDKRENLLRDPDAKVRAALFRKLFAVERSQAIRQSWIEAARTDEDPAVRAEGLHVMEESPELEADLRRLFEEGGEAAVKACEVIGKRRLASFHQDLLMGLFAPQPVVKIAAVQAIGQIGGNEAATNLTELLVGADEELRKGIEQALIEVGAAAIPEMTRFVHSPNYEIWRTTVKVMNAVGTENELREWIVPSCGAKLKELAANRDKVEQIRGMNREEWTALARMRSEEIRASLLDTIWEVMICFGDERSIPPLRQAVESEDEEVRDHGLEILSEGFGDTRLASALLHYYQGGPNPVRILKSQDETAAPEPDSLSADPWLQAIAIKAGAVKGEATLMQNWDYLSALDKIVFLKQVPLFEDLSIEELGRIASIAHEKVYEEDDMIVKQGEPSFSFVVIVDGHIEISGVNEDGVEGTLGVLGPKQSLGEGALFDQRPSLISAQVLFEPARVLEIEQEETRRLVRLYPDIGVGLLRTVGSRLRQMEYMLLKLG